MAEGDSILRIARRLDQALAGQAISARTPGPRRPTGLAPGQLYGRILERVESRGKNLLLHFEDRLVLPTMQFAPIGDLADIEPVLEQMGERSQPEADAAPLAAVRTAIGLGPDAAPVEVLDVPRPALPRPL